MQLLCNRFRAAGGHRSQKGLGALLLGAIWPGGARQRRNDGKQQR